jgi:hypothetical protein
LQELRSALSNSNAKRPSSRSSKQKDLSKRSVMIEDQSIEEEQEEIAVEE